MRLSNCSIRPKAAAMLAVAAIAVGTNVEATTIVANGRITTYGYGLGDAFAINQPFTFAFDYRGLGTDVSPNQAFAYYTQAGSNLAFKSGAYEMSARDVAFVFETANPNRAMIASAFYLASTIRGTEIQGPMVGDRFPYWLSIEPGFDIRTDPATWASRPGGAAFTLSFAREATPLIAFGVASALGVVDSWEVRTNQVPEPPTWLLAAMGLCSLLLRSRSSSR